MPNINDYSSDSLVFFSELLQDRYEGEPDNTILINYSITPTDYQIELQKWINENNPLETNRIVDSLRKRVFPYWFPSIQYSGENFKVGGPEWPKQIPKASKYNLIYAELPINLKRVNYFDEKDNLVAKVLTYLNNEGSAIFLASTSMVREFKRELPLIGFHINAIFNTSQSFLNASRLTLELCLVVVSQNKSDNIFFAEVPESTREIDTYACIELANNFFSPKKESNSLSEGMLLPLDYDFLGFRAIHASLEIDKLQSIYKDYKKFSMGQLASAVNLARQDQRFTERRNAIYIPRVGNSPVISSIKEGKLKHHNYIQVLLSSNAINEYVASFFKSNLGKLSLDSIRYGFISSISKINLLKLEIPLPDIQTQKKIISIDKQIDNVQNNLNLLKDELAVNPLNVSTLNAIDDISSSINELTTGDQLRGFIVSGESKTIEFKETFSLNVFSQQKDTDIEHSSLKTIVGFLNSNGGKLFIGVNDSQEIIGVDKEVDKFYKGNLDKYLLHFKNNIGNHIGLQFSDYIDYGIQKLEGINVLVVDCLESLKPCFLDEKDFYVRTNPSTDKLEGEKQWKYIQSHFKNLQIYNELLEFVEENEIVCPMPIHWNNLYRLIVRRIHGNEAVDMNVVGIREDFGIETPLILGGWIASNSDKKERFLSHIQIAAENNIINHVKQFLMNLSAEDFLHGDGLSQATGELTIDEDFDLEERE
jgi:hypothetical protein